MHSVADILTAEGFQPIGQLKYDLDLSVWWHPRHHLQLISVVVGRTVLLKASKPYVLVSGGADDEMWARDLAAAQDYLEAHFREVHLSWSFFRDVPAFIALRHANDRLASSASKTGADNDVDIGRRVQQAEASLRSAERILELDSGDSELLRSHLQTRETQAQADLEQRRALLAQAEGRSEALRHLQQEYRRKGSALCLLVSIASNLQVVSGADDTRDAVRALVKELLDAHRFQVTQTFGGRLKIKLAETQAPALAWIEQWFGGALTPTQLEQLNERGFAETISRHTIVTPDDNITVEGTAIERRKLVAPRLVSGILDRLDAPHRQRIEPPSDHGPHLRIGLLADIDGGAGEAWTVALRDLGHVAISGSTGSGKSIAVRVLTEEIAHHDGIGVLVLDPRNQSAGLATPQDQPDLLARYQVFGLTAPRAFLFAYFGPGSRCLLAPPPDLSELATGRSILSFKALDDESRCDLFARTLDAVFVWASRSEADSVRLVVLVEEAQLFTRRLAATDAKAAAGRAEAALDRVLREGRKYGLMAVVSSQSIMDFARDAAAIRQNATTKVFFRNSDREIEYARDYVEDPRELVRLPPGVGLFCSSAWQVARVAVRPPLSKVWDFGEAQTAALFQENASQVRTVSPEADRLLAATREYMHRSGSPPHMSEAARAAGITSKRRLQHLVQELEAAGLARTSRLRGQGQPRIIEPIGPAGGQNAGETGQEVGHGPSPGG